MRIFLALLLLVSVAHGGTVTSVSVSSNGTILRPTNFATANGFPSLTGNNTFSGNQTLTSNLSVQGDTTLGDASGDKVTINAGTITAPNASSTNSTDVANVGALDARYISAVAFALAADTNYSSNNTPSDLTGFSASVIAGATYQIDFQYFASVATGGATAGGIKFIFSGPSVTSSWGLRRYGQNNGTSAFFGLSNNNTTPDASISAGGFSDSAWTSGIVRSESHTIKFAASGTLKIQASQNTSHATATKLWGGYTAWTIRRIN